MNTIDFPNQKLSYKEKSKNDFEWAKRTIDYLCNQRFNVGTYHRYADNGNIYDGTHDYHRKLTNYRLYNNIVSQEDFQRDLNPYNIQVQQVEDVVLPYVNAIPNKINAILNEDLKRPFNFQCVIEGSDGIKKKLQAKDKYIRGFIEKQLELYASQLRAQYTGVEEEELQQVIQKEMEVLYPAKEVSKLMMMPFLDRKEITGNKILAHLKKELSLIDKKFDSFKHGLISGEEMVYIGVKHGRPVIEIVNPLGFFSHRSAEVKMVQDGLYAGYVTTMTSSDILTSYGEYLPDDVLERFNGISNYGGGFTTLQQKSYREVEDNYININSFDEGSYGKRKGNDWEVTHVEWVSQAKIGFVEAISKVNGELEVDVVEEGFKVPATAKKEYVTVHGKKRTQYLWEDDFMFYKLEWKWRPQVWEGVRIGQDIYCCIGIKRNQFFSKERINEVKLGYFGITYSAMNAPAVSLVDRLKPLQYLLFVVTHKLKELVAKDRGKVFHFDETMVPKELGIEKTLYYLDKLDIDIYNPLQNAEMSGAAQRGKITGSTDRSNMQYILNYIALIDSLDRQMGDIAGVPKGREGQTSPTMTATNAQQDLMQSSTVTEMYFHLHNFLWKEVLNGLLSTTIKCMKEDSTLYQYVFDDEIVETIALTEDGVEDVDLGVHLIDSANEWQVLQQLRANALAFVQNDRASFSTIIELFKANSVSEIKESVKAFEQESAQMKQQEAENQLQMQREALAYDRETKLLIEEAKRETAIEKAKIDTFKFQNELDSDKNQIPDHLEVDKFLAKMAIPKEKK